jgi:hypothetical protein
MVVSCGQVVWLIGQRVVACGQMVSRVGHAVGVGFAGQTVMITGQ